MNKSLFTFLILLTFLFSANLVPSPLMGQPSPDQIDFATIDVDELSDQQVKRLYERAEASGRTEQDLEAEAIARGMPYSEVMKLRSRISALKEGVEVADEPDTVPGRQATAEMPDGPEVHERERDPGVLRVFGHDLFRRRNLSFEPSLNIPTPVNYQLGAGDELVIEVWGASQQTYRQSITPEGQISITNVGPIQVNGLTIEDASRLIINRLSSKYSGLKGPNANTFAQVTLGTVRSINVTIVGESYMPGTYTLPGFATAFNALYASGGPGEKGSFRDIRVIRNGETITSLDLYEFLLKGNTTINIRLQDQDLIFVGPYKNRITIAGEVKRPAIYEMKELNTLADLVNYAGGFTPNTFSARVQVDRKTDKQRKLLNVDKELFSSFILQNGDFLQFGRILERYENRVRIEGAVFREGVFALSENMTLTQLIEKAEGLREDAFLQRAAIYRLKDDLQTEAIEVNLQAVLDGSRPDILLQREDLVFISSIVELKAGQIVQIRGAVREPSDFPFAQDLTLGEVIRKAGGLQSSASLARVEVARRIVNPQALEPAENITEIFTFPLDENLSIGDEAASFPLQPFDIIFVRRSPGYQPQITVRADGEFAFPGSYAISHKNERISDLIARAGGLTREAYPKGATLIRTADEGFQDRRRQIRSLETGELEIDLSDQNRTQRIGIDLQDILRNPGSPNDLILQEGDVLRVPLKLETVRMSGAVLYPTSALYQRRAGVRSYISQAGGFAENAKKGKIFVVYPNGSVDRTRSFLGIRSYPSLEPGAEIVVPEKPEREPRTLQETIAISSAMTSLALMIVTLINQF